MVGREKGRGKQKREGRMDTGRYEGGGRKGGRETHT